MLDLDEPRDVKNLLVTTFFLYRRHFLTLVAMAATVVIPANLLLGIGLKQITTHYRAHPTTRTLVIELAASLLVIVPLLNAATTQMLIDLGAGRRASFRRSMQVGLDRFVPAFISVIIYGLGVAVGLSFFLFPGIFLMVMWIFGPQIAVAENASGMLAIGTSGRIVQRQWFRVAGALLVVTLAVGLPDLAVEFGADRAAKAANLQGVQLLISTLFQTLALPFIAVGTSLIYFDARHRAGDVAARLRR